jgi:hypothetical protein
MINYRDYLGQFDMSQRGNESWTAPMDENAWNSLDERGKWGSVSDTVGILQGDNRYDQYKPQGAQGTYSLNYTGGKPLSSEMVVDPSRARNVGGDVFSIAQENFTPKAQSNGEENPLWALAPLLVMSAPLWAGALGIGGATAEGVGLLGGADIGLGASEIGTAAAAGAPEAAAAGLDLVGAGPGAALESGAMGGANYSGAGMIAPGMDAAAVADSFLINNGMSGLSGGMLTGALSGAPFAHLGGAGGALGGLLSSALSNPLQAIGLLHAVSGLVGGGKPGDPGNGAPGGSGSPVNLPKGNRGAWTPNPFTQNQIQNFRYTGSR